MSRNVGLPVTMHQLAIGPKSSGLRPLRKYRKNSQSKSSFCATSCFRTWSSRRAANDANSSNDMIITPSASRACRVTLGNAEANTKIEPVTTGQALDVPNLLSDLRTAPLSVLTLYEVPSLLEKRIKLHLEIRNDLASIVKLQGADVVLLECEPVLSLQSGEKFGNATSNAFPFWPGVSAMLTSCCATVCPTMCILIIKIGSDVSTSFPST